MRWGKRTLSSAAALAVSAVAAAAVFYIAVSVFPYHSMNHDEAVYLQQASMLLDGRLRMRAPSPALVEAFRPWFFVVDGAEMYPKYTPVPAAVFALGELLGGYRLSLAGVAFANTLLVYLVAREGFDDTVAVVASVLLVASPFFLVNTALFLPYATTTVFNLIFALGYIRGFLTGDRVRLVYAAVAGVGIGVSFFSRPYTAVLFASPFVVHALHTLYSRLRRDGPEGVRRHLVGYTVVSTLGIAFVCVTLAYNTVMTGSPFTFPYLEFAPRDGLGFGRRAILGYDRVYTPTLGVRSNAWALWRLASDWTTAGLLGSALAVVGGVYAFVGDGGPERRVRLLLVGVVVSFVVGNVYFWGTLNILGEIGDPTDGLISLYGPYYHYDLLLPVSVFMAFGAVSAYRYLGSRIRDTAPRAAPVVAVVVAFSLAAPAVAAVDDKVERNAEITEVYEEAYHPFEGIEFGDALVLLPTPYGDWLNHPFQYLRNRPDLSGDVVYALDRGPENLGVLDAYPNRTYYRYSYRGEWEPYTGERVEPELERVELVEADSPGGVRLSTEVRAGEASSVSVGLRSGDGDPVYYTVPANGTVSVDLVVDGGDRAVYPASRPNVSVPVGVRDEVELTVHIVRGYLDEVTYRQRFVVGVGDGTVRVVSPETEYCPSPTGCAGETAYVGDDGRIRTRLSAIRPNGDVPG